jgi:hypothetical protein
MSSPLSPLGGKRSMLCSMALIHIENRKNADYADERG